MRRLTRKLLDLFRTRPTGTIRTRPVSRRLALENLEDRFAPAVANATGTITGVAFVDSNSNLVRDPGEFLVPGVSINLTGRTTAQNKFVNVSVTTNANGAFTFTNVQPGIYTLGSNTNVLVHEFTKFSTSPEGDGGTVFAQVTVTGGQTVKQNVGFLGVAPAFVGQAEFLNSSTNPLVEILPPGSGVASASPRADNAPTVSSAIADITATQNGTNSIDLAGHFTDPDITDSTIQINTNRGSFQVQLFDKEAPQTVANFFDYITSGAYNNDVFHRLAINSDGSKFVLQGGGFTLKSGTTPTIVPVTTLPTVPNEFSSTRSNTAGTLAMAKLGSDPNSASSQFFINLGNNSSNLDSQNGGFTVFGKIIGQVSTTSVSDPTVTRLDSAKPTSETNFNSAFTDLPLQDSTITANDPKFPGDTERSDFDLIQNVQIIHRSEALTYSIVSNSNPDLVFTTLQHEHMTLTYASGKTGSATIVVKATDMFGASVTTSFKVTISASTPSATVTLNKPSPTVFDSITATATTSNADGDPVKLTYTWTDTTQNRVLQTTSNTSATTDTLNLRNFTGINAGDGIVVSVTPTSDGLSGSVATATATVVATSTPSVTVGLNNTTPSLADTITATATPSNLDGDPVTLTYQWIDTGPTGTGNVVLQTDGPTASTTDKLNLSGFSGVVNAGDIIRVSVTPVSDGVTGTAFNATATVVATSTPSATVVLTSSNNTSPASPSLADTLTATATTSNADGDPVTLTYQWIDTGPNGTGNPVVLKTTSNTSALTDQLNLSGLSGVNANDVIEVSVTPMSDGQTGTAATATATAQAISTPSVKTLTLDNHKPTVTQTITATVVTSNTDNDPVKLTYQWVDTTNSHAGPSGNGILRTTSNTSALTDQLNLTGLANVSVGDVITLSVTPTSDNVTGTTDMATATVEAHSTPSATVSLDETNPTLFESITATATTSNADGSPVTLTYTWTDTTQNNLVLQTTNNTSSTTDTLNLQTLTGVKVGDVITVSVVPSSNGLNGSPATPTTPATVVAPSTPSATVSLDQSAPTLNDTLTATATTSNSDGDPVTLTYQWIDTRTGATLQTTSNTSATTDKLNLKNLTGVDVGDTIQVTVTPSSDNVMGSPVMATAKIAVDSAPMVDSVSISPTTATATSTLTATPTGHDTDGDAVTFTYQWSIQGEGDVTNATSSTLDLTKLPTGFTVKTGSVVTVTVTASDGSLSSSPFSQSIKLS
jgi:peptidyl-prolyl cis-trans isomerase A (cyclophilin A)